MKTENTLENKKRFFALYFGQEVVCHKSMPFPSDRMCARLEDSQFPEYYLLLRPLSSIYDEYANVIGEYRNKAPQKMTYTELGHHIVNGFVRQQSNGERELEIFEIDYLRGKGYALPFMDIPVPTLVEWGWIELAEV